MAWTNKTKESINSGKRDSLDLWLIGRFAIRALCNGPEVLSSKFDEAKLLKTFLETLILAFQLSLHLLSLLN